MADEDLWHVRIAPDEVKILSLEKLDDLFRLDVIDADVLVWQPGMDEWLPLRVVAGIGDDEPEVVEIAVSEPPRPIGNVTSTAWPPQAIPKSTLAWPPQTLPPPPSSRSMLERPSSRAPASHAPVSQPPPSRGPLPLPAPPPALPSRAPVSGAHSSSAWPPPAAWDAPRTSAPPRAPAPAPLPYPTGAPSRAPAHAPAAYATTVSAAAAQFPLYADAPAHAAAPARAMLETDISLRRRSGGGGGRWVVVVALAAGAVVTLYRNGMVHAAAKSMGQESAYSNLESALGGASFGTPRAVEKMTESSRSLLESIATASALEPTRSAATAAPTSTSTPEPVAAKTPEPAPATKPSESLAAAAKAASGPTKPVSATAPAPRPAAVAKEPPSPFKTPKSGKKGKGNEFDPLNGNL